MIGRAASLRHVRLRPAPARAAALALVLAALAIAVCGSWALFGQGAGTSQQALTIATEPSPPPPGDICALVRFGAVEMRRAGSRVVFTSPTGQDVQIVWPYGTTARLVDGRAEMFAPDGTLIATEGQLVSGPGGGLGADDAFHVCTIGY
jgi:hypothetical protein